MIYFFRSLRKHDPLAWHCQVRRWITKINNRNFHPAIHDVIKYFFKKENNCKVDYAYEATKATLEI